MVRIFMYQTLDECLNSIAQCNRSKSSIETRPIFFDQVGHQTTWPLDVSIFSLNHVIVRPTKIMNNLLKYCEIRTYKVQSNLVIRNFLVTLKLFLNAKSSLSLWSKLAFGHRKWFLYTNLSLIKTFLITKFDCTLFSKNVPNLCRLCSWFWHDMI